MGERKAFPRGKPGDVSLAEAQEICVGLRVNSKGRTHPLGWVSNIDEKSSLLIKSHSRVSDVPISKRKCGQSALKIVFELVSSPGYAI